MKLETGYNNSFEVRFEYAVAAVAAPLTVLYISDLHFNRYSAGMVAAMISRIHRLDPDIILLGGDYVDSKNGLLHFNTLMQSFSNRKNVFAIAGNHDYFFGLEEIKKMMTDNKVIWLEKNTVNFNLHNSSIQLNGNLLLIEKKEADLSILFLHKPVHLDKHERNYDLAFAGHLHGCQFVLWQYKKALYPGRLFYKMNVLEKKMNRCHYLISRGMGDTLPIRFNCSKEMIFVTINSNKI
jgi:hypothetical protein